MIKKIKVSGYKSLKDVEVQFQPLSIFIGPNAAGKSNLLDALSLISGIVTKKNLKEAFAVQRGLPLESFYYGDDGFERLLEKETAEASFEVDVELSPSVIAGVEKLIMEKRKGMEADVNPKKRITENYLRYAATIQILPKTGHLRMLEESLNALTKSGEIKKSRNAFIEKHSISGKTRLHLRMEGQAHPSYFDIGLEHSVLATSLYEPHYPHIAAFRQELSAWRFYYFEPRTLMREDVPLAEVEAIGSRGENLAAFINKLQSDGGQQMENFNLSLKYLLPSIERIEIIPTPQGLLSLKLYEHGVPYSGRIVSEGTLRILGLLAALHPAAPTTVIGYEEPENGVHPARLKLVSDLFKNIQDQYHKQLIINTHSAIFPTYFEDSHLYVCSKENGLTQISPFQSFGPLYKDADISTALDEKIIRGDYGG
jgi:predicted ATPase